MTRGEWATLLSNIYAAAQSVDDDEAHDRLTQALASNDLLQELNDALAVALAEARGPRTTEDEQLDKLSFALQKRRSRVAAPEIGTEMAAALVRIDLEIGVAAEAMRDMLSSPKGAKLLETGRAQLMRHVVRELLK